MQPQLYTEYKRCRAAQERQNVDRSAHHIMREREREREREKRRSRKTSIYTCKLRDSPPAAEAMSVDEGDKLLVFFRCPWPFLQSYLIAARFSPHPSKLLTPSFISCCFLSLRDLPPSLSLLTDLDLSQRTALILSLKEVERVFSFPGLATQLQKINKKKLDLTKEAINQVRFYSINRSLSKIVFLSRNS